jgi:hypothetical protein
MSGVCAAGSADGQPSDLRLNPIRGLTLKPAEGMDDPEEIGHDD